MKTEMIVLLTVLAWASPVDASENMSADGIESTSSTSRISCDRVVDQFVQAETAYAGHPVESSVAAPRVAAWCGDGSILPDDTGDITIPPDDDDPAMPGKCVSFDMLDSDPGDGVYCTIWCGWKIEHAEYEVEITATSGPTESKPLVYAGVGCSNVAFYHTLPFGIACGGWDFQCTKYYGEGTELQWGSCLFWAGGDHAKIQSASCSWEA